jgi:hypothetical protein
VAWECGSAKQLKMTHVFSLVPLVLCVIFLIVSPDLPVPAIADIYNGEQHIAAIATDPQQALLGFLDCLPFFHFFFEIIKTNIESYRTCLQRNQITIPPSLPPMDRALPPMPVLPATDRSLHQMFPLSSWTL